MPEEDGGQRQSRRILALTQVCALLLGLDVEREAGAAHVSHDARHEVALLGGHLDDEARVAPRDGARGERVALALHQRRQLALRRRRKLADRKPACATPTGAHKANACLRAQLLNAVWSSGATQAWRVLRTIRS
eukprot:6210225-Pleurochrysis_carterae.AAC.1